jgi:putative DNA primase/helicase
MQYNGKVWSITTDEVVGLAASNVLVEVYKEKYLAAGRDTQQMKQYNTLTKEACTGTRIQGALYFLKGTEGFSTEPKQWNANPWLFNVNNGTIDLKTRKLLEHNPDDLLTMISPIDFDEDTSSMDWYEFLRFFLPNREIRRQIQRDIGLALPGVALEEALPFWWGTGGNGKSTASRILSEIFGSYAKKAAPNLLVKSKYEGHPTELADLAGSRLVFAIETEKGSCLAETRVKELTGGDTVKARWMYGDFFEFSKTFSIFLITNDKPKIQGTDNSIWRRMRLIPWTKTVSSEERKPQAEVVEHLIHGSVGSSILSWALDGLADWEEDHTWIAQEVKAITADYRQESDRLGAFLKECCDIGETYKVAVADLHQRYVDWCKEVEEEELDRIHFGKQLKESARVIQKKSNSVCCWNGIRLKRM